MGLVKKNHLSFLSPFYFIKDRKFIVSQSVDEIITQKESDNFIDFTAVVQILNTGFAFGDRTLIKNIHRTPWLAQPNNSNDNWEHYELPQHREERKTTKEVAQTFYKLVKHDLIEYIGDKKNIAILLTGGMDSRIVACALNELIISNELSNLNITALTWGFENSRDVVYAEKISQIFKWNFVNLSVSAGDMLNNLSDCVKMGCEFSPIHLHAMNKVNTSGNYDCVLAGSFGDSIGRAEYSGVKVQNLKPLESTIRNIGGILRNDYQGLTSTETKQDINKYHSLFPQPKEYQQYELDYQLHYMRRMLNSCFSIIAEKTPVYQLFSSPKIFEYIWSIHPEIRNDEIYNEILKSVNPEIMKIPWARTGIIYPLTHGKPDQYLKNHHKYGELLRNEIMPKIKETIYNGPLESLNIFNLKSIKTLISLCTKKPINSTYYYEEKLIWLACLSEYISKHNIKSEYSTKKDHNPIQPKVEYMAKYYKRKLF